MSNTIQWWLEDEERAGPAMRTTLNQIRADQHLFQTANLTHIRMYRNLAMVGLGPHTSFTMANGIGSPLSLNVVRNMCNAVHSQIAKNRPKPWFQTDGGGVKTQQRSQKLEQYIKGTFYQQKFYPKRAQSFLDCAILGTGCMKVMPGKKCVTIERIFTPEVVVDNVEGMHREPRNIYQYKYIDRGYLIAEHPDKADAIKAIPALEFNYEDEEMSALNNRHASDLVRVEEGYHTASEEGADDGVYVKAANGVTLQMLPWAHDWSPYVFERWSTSPLGMWGMGLAEELRGIQLEINHLVRNIQSAMGLLSNPYVLVDRAANVSRGQITNVQGSVLLYTGKAPSVYAPSVVHPEVFAHLDRLYQKAYEIAGVSQMTAQAQKPAGFTSGRAQLVHADLASERFAMVAREDEEMCMNVARLVLKVSRGVPGIKVKSFGDNGYNEVDFKKDLASVTDDDFVLQVMPTALLGDTPEAQIEMSERLTKAGLISESTDVLRQIDHPDMKALVRRKTAPRVLTELTVQAMLDGGPQQVPLEESNLKLTLQIASEMYVEAKLQHYDDDALSKVRNYMKTCVRMQTSTGGTPQAGAAGAAMGGAPAPMALPANGLTPGVAGPPVAMPPNGFTPVPGAIQ